MTNPQCPRYIKTALALAACQLLFACAQVPQAQFVSHFGSDGSTPTETLAVTGDASSENEREQTVQEPQIVQGTGKVLNPPTVPAGVKGAPIKLSFEDAPLGQVVQTILGDILKVDYVLHPPITGSVTMSTQKSIPLEQVLNLLETALQSSGLAMTRDARGTYHVGSLEALRNVGMSVRVASVGEPLAPGYGVVVLPLQYIGAGEMASILRPMAGESAILRVDSVRNLLVMAGTRGQADGWLEMVRTFDIDLLEGMSVGVFPLKYVNIDEVTQALQTFNGGGAAADAVGQQLAGQSAAHPAGAGFVTPAVLSGALHVMPIPRLNSVMVITSRPAYLEQVKRWISKFDQASAIAGEAQLHIYQVENGNAKHLAGVLGGIFGGESVGTEADSGVSPGLASTQGTAPGLAGGVNSSSGNPGVGGASRMVNGTSSKQVATGASHVTKVGNIRVMADELNNSVLIWGTPAEYERLEKALRKLDVPPTQVLIEASIIEVTLNDSLRYGLEWAFNNSSGRYSGDGKLSSGGGGLGEALASGFTYTVRNSAGSIRAALNALSSKTNLKVVASPTLMVLDNHTASINVGTQQPYQTGSTYSANSEVITTNIQYKDTGVGLEVTPSVNAGNMVTMTVNQTVTDVGAQDEVTKQRSFLQRQVTSRVAVRSGESIVMGGLIQESATQGRTGIPFLHELPVVGNLFGSTSKSGARTELIVVITPRVVRTDVDIRGVTENLREQMSGLRELVFPRPKTEAESVEPVKPQETLFLPQ